VEACFPKLDARPRVAELAWPDGTTAVVPQYQHVTRLPHDLAHYAVDAVLRPRWGFWELAARKAPFSNVTPSRPWPRERQEWFARVVRDHRDEMVEAERLTGLLSGQASSWEAARRALHSAWTDRPGNPRPDLTRERYRQMLELHEALTRAWATLPLGGRLCVAWPPTAPGLRGPNSP